MMTGTLGYSNQLTTLISDDEVVYASLMELSNWQGSLMLALSKGVDTMIARGDLPIDTADALDDLGQLCQRLGQAIIFERQRRGMPMPLGPDD